LAAVVRMLSSATVVMYVCHLFACLWCFIGEKHNPRNGWIVDGECTAAAAAAAAEDGEEEESESLPTRVDNVAVARSCGEGALQWHPRRGQRAQVHVVVLL
jgi:hypothetical protein